MNSADLSGILRFARDAERLKSVTRTSWTSEGQPETVAAHSWRLSLMAIVLEGAFPGVDMARLMKMCTIHDLGEAIGGDISAKLQPAEGKAEQERRDLVQLLEPLPAGVRGEILALWDEYEGGATLEARVAKALDKLETILQHNQGRNPPGFDYAFNLDYGRRYTSDDPVIAEIRGMLDEETRARAEESGGERA